MQRFSSSRRDAAAAARILVMTMPIERSLVGTEIASVRPAEGAMGRRVSFEIVMTAVALGGGAQIACIAHRASPPLGSTLVVAMPEADTASFRIGAGVVGDNKPSLGVAGGFRIEDFGIELVAEGGLDGEFDATLPEVALGIQTSAFAEPLRVDIGFGATQSGFLMSTRLALASDVALGDGFSIRPVGALTSGLPFGSSCGGEFFTCPHGETEPSVGLEAALAFGSELGATRLLIAPTAQVLTVGNDVHGVWAITLQVDFAEALPLSRERDDGWSP